MTTYSERTGRRQSLYRKRTSVGGLVIQAINTPAVTPVFLGPTDGTRLLKSIRALLMLPALGVGAYAAGWVGWSRTTSDDVLVGTNVDLANSTIFGVQNWAIGPTIDQLIVLELKGLTLTHGETGYLVGDATFKAGSVSIAMFGNILFAEQNVPA